MGIKLFLNIFLNVEKAKIRSRPLSSLVSSSDKILSRLTDVVLCRIDVWHCCVCVCVDEHSMGKEILYNTKTCTSFLYIVRNRQTSRSTTHYYKERT